MTRERHTAAGPAAWLSIGALLAGILLLPLGLRVVNTFLPSATLSPSFIPSIESPRHRTPFDRDVVATLQEARPDYVVIGDSMAGTRINPGHLSRLVGGRGVAALLHPGTGSAYWYLVFKNFVVNARFGPKAVVFFFRDENLTDPLFRVYPGVLDRAAYDREAALDRILSANMHGTFYQAHLAAQRAYQFNRTRDWLEPQITNMPLGAVVGTADRTAFLEEMNQRHIPQEALRPMVAADMPGATETALDFDRRLPQSVLPEIIRLSKLSGIRVAFVRVQRRPRPDGPPLQSAALQQYVAKLSAWLAENGAHFHDDWGDPDQPLRIYEDGDHIARDYRLLYTELFFRKNRGLFQ
ncbi:MAG: hypothetical protein Q7V01_09725 [Vicinamibacterales bacterium]|nr:hypothetical protein [Vicinamibacterales bacterium]